MNIPLADMEFYGENIAFAEKDSFHIVNGRAHILLIITLPASKVFQCSTKIVVHDRNSIFNDFRRHLQLLLYYKTLKNHYKGNK